MSGMIERVARAIAKANDDDDYDLVSEPVRELYREEARAAIAAMRDVLDQAVIDCAFGSVWSRMIDAALAQKSNADSQIAKSGLEV